MLMQEVELINYLRFQLVIMNESTTLKSIFILNHEILTHPLF